MTVNVDNYGWNAADAPQSCEWVAPAVLSILRKLKVGRVLDLGAGNGALCGALSAQGFEMVGVEYDQRGVTLAARTHPRVRFYRYGVQDDPALLLQEEAPFDAVVSTEVIEHLYAPHLLPRYAHGVLAAGGHLIVSTPYHGYLKNLGLSIAGAWDKHHTPLWHGGHIKFWSRVTLSQLLEENGFSVTGFAGVGRLPWLWKSMLLTARRNAGDAGQVGT